VIELVTHSPEETQRLGKALGALAKPGDLFLLSGDLGAGKTCLTQGIAWGMGVEDHVRSPTFVLLTEYQGRLPLYHADLYRLGTIEELFDLGFDEYLEDSNGVLVVEWADRVPEGFPDDHLLIRLETPSEEERRLTLIPHGHRYEELVNSLQSDVASPA
jgi:tRNA threonylcarbamoyladenosine biosynthesis protein TsaE